MKHESYRPLILDCNHRVGPDSYATAPKEGGYVFCSRCGQHRQIVVVGGMWRVRCKDCSMSRVCESGGLARATARPHMLRRRHHVLLFDMARPLEETLEILQPVADMQLRLDDQPPF